MVFYHLHSVYGKSLELLSVYPLLSTESKKEASTVHYLELRLFKEDLGFEDISLWLLLLATWLLAWGLTSIIHPKKRHIEIEDIEYSTNSIINITSSFGAKVQYIQTNDLQYVTIDSKFSGLKLYFDQATIQNQATIEVDGNFTGIELYVPKEWNVQSHVRAFFGGVDEKGQPSSSGYPTLNITGRIHFGGVEIHYI